MLEQFEMIEQIQCLKFMMQMCANDIMALICTSSLVNMFGKSKQKKKSALFTHKSRRYCRLSQRPPHRFGHDCHCHSINHLDWW